MRQVLPQEPLLLHKKSMLLDQFAARFPTEESCMDYFRSVRERVGVTCAHCKGKRHKWVAYRRCFQCLDCGHWTPLTVVTVMEHSKLPLRSWFYTTHLITSIKQVLSAKEVQHQLRLAYAPTWLMMMKLRDVMGKRDAEYMLSGEVELDEVFFPTRADAELKGQQLKRGAGSQKKAKVLVMAESKPADDILLEYMASFVSPGASDLDKKATKIGDFSRKAEKMSVKKAVNYIKMFALDNLQAPTVDLLANWHIEKHTKVVTDASSSHVNFKDLFDQHEVHNESGSDVDVETNVKTNLPWVHLVAKECRNGIEAIHKEVDRRYLQLYLNEYCWKFNRRFFRDSSDPKYDLFDRLIKISAMYTSDIKYDTAAAEAYNQSDYVDAWGALTDI